MARKTLTHAEVVRLYDLIKPRLREAEHGLFTYEPGWDDAKIAEVSKIEGVTSQHVGRVRQQAFGALKLSPGQGGGSGMRHATQLAFDKIFLGLAIVNAKLNHLQNELGAKPWPPELAAMERHIGRITSVASPEKGPAPEGPGSAADGSGPWGASPPPHQRR